MNYQGNRGKISSTLDNPGLFNALQAELAGKTKNDTPLLLLPLRLETRFMRVRKNLLDEVLSPETATAVKIGKALTERIKDYTFFSQYAGPKAVMAATLVREDMEAFRDSIGAVASGNFLEKRLLLELADNLEQSASPMISHLETFLTDGSPESAKLSEEEGRLQTAGQQTHSRLDLMPDSLEWTGSVSGRVQQLVSKILSIINDNEAVLNNGMESEQAAQAVSAGIAAIRSELRSVSQYNDAEKLAVLQQLGLLNSQVDILQQRIEEETGGDPLTASARAKEVLTAAAAAADTWQGILAPGLERDRFVAAEENAYILSPDHPVTDDLSGGRDALSAEVDSIRTYYDQLLSGGAQWDPGMEAAVLGHLAQIDAVLAGLPSLDDTNDRRFLYQGLDGFNDLLYGITSWLINKPAQGGTETTIIGTQPGFHLEDGEFYDEQGNEVSPQGGYGVSADGAIARQAQERISIRNGFRISGEYILDLQSRPVAPSHGYSLQENGIILTPEGEKLSNKTGFLRHDDYFLDAAGNRLSPAGGYGVDSDKYLVAPGPETLVTEPGLFQLSGGKIKDMEGKPFSAGAGYGVDEEGFIVKTTSTAPDNADSAEAISKAALGVGHEWARVIGAARQLKPFDSTYEVDELWIRAYPDDIFVTQLEEALTQSEHDAGVDYWSAWWAASGVKEQQLLAWQDLVRRFGPQRAAWIVRQLTPSNFSNLPAVASAQQLNAQAVALQTFTAQIDAVSVDAQQQQSVPYYLGIFDEKVSGMQGSAKKLQGATEALFDLLSGNVNSLKESFTGLSGKLRKINPEFGEATQSVSEKIASLTATIESQNRPGNWSEMFAAEPAFPADIEIKLQPWTEQSYSETLPHRLIFSTINQKPAPDTSYVFPHIKIGNVIPATVYTSLKPDLGSLTSPNAVNAGNIGVDKGPTGELVFDPSIKWMFDYGEAVAKGMACSIRLTTAEAKAGFDTVIVTGVKTNEGNAAWADEPSTRTKSKQLLEKLLTGHLYSEGGMELLRLGTPTNNTDDSDAGFNQPDPYSLDSFANLVSAPLFYGSGYKMNRKDGQWISDLLGVDYSVFAHVKGAGQRQISNGIAMNRALWSATAGGYMDEMLNRLFSDDQINRARAYFTDYVLARGMMPSLRVGKQPYGILATTSFTRWYTPKLFDLAAVRAELQTNLQRDQLDLELKSPWVDNPDSSSVFDAHIRNNPARLEAFRQDRFNGGIERVLQKMSDIWLEMFRANAKTIDGINADQNLSAEARQAAFMNALGTDATLSEAHVRFMLNSFSYTQLYEGRTFDELVSPSHSALSTDSGSTASTSVAAYIGEFRSLFFPSGTYPMLDVPYMGNDPDPLNLYLRAAKIFSAQQMKDHFYLKTPRVDEVALSEEAPVGNIPSLGKNYIQWLLDSSLGAIWKNNEFDKLPARSLLFQLLRQSMLLTYRNEALNIMERAEVLNKQSRDIIGTADGYALQLSTFSNQRLLTKWHLAFNSLDQLANHQDFGQALPRYLNFGPYATFADYNLPTNLPSWKFIAIGDYLKFNSNTNAALNAIKSLDRINELKESFGILKNLPTAELDRLLSEHIDLCSYRMDAWDYGKVHKRLLEQRGVDASSGARKTGTYIGAYGWLLDVRPKSPELPVPNVNSKIHPLLQSAAGAVTYDRLNLGFIHTPSMAHAITAAMMRSGFVSERLGEDNSFSINLTSQRVSKAISLLEGMRNGQTLSELLGYEFEKGLFERGAAYSGLQEYVAFFRKVFPLAGGQAATVPIATAESIRPTNVCDGIDLLNAFKGRFESQMRANPTLSIYELFAGTATLPAQVSYGQLDSWISGLTQPPAAFSIQFGSNTGAARAFVTEIDRLANALDAVGDLSLTEGVLQISKGNNDRSAAVMESLTEGKNMPELEVTETPRTGYRISSRMLSLLSASQWTPAKFTTPKSSLEPRVNSWIEHLLMSYLDVADIYLEIGCRASFADSTDPQNPVPFEVDVTLNDLEINPIELAYMMQAGSFLSELSERVKHAVRRHWTGISFFSLGGIPAAVDIEVDLTARGATALTPPATVGTVSFAEIVTILDAIHNVIANARALSPDDFVYTAEDATSAAKFDLQNDVLPRVNGLAGQFSTAIPSSARSQVDARINLGVSAIASQTDLDDINQILMRCADLGISAAIPRFVKENVSNTAAFSKIAEEMYRQLQAVRAEMVKRYAQVSAPAPAASEDEQLAIHNDNIAALLGSRFLLLPKFRFAHYNGLESLIHRQLRNQRPAQPAGYSAAEDLLSHVDQGPPASSEGRRDEIMDDWMYSLARTERRVDELETLRMLTGSTVFGKLRPLQFPFTDTTASPVVPDYWMGAEYPDSYELTGDKLSIALFNSDLIQAPATLPSLNEYCGIFICNWNEVIPHGEETTGITFHYDQPNAKAPQNLLLAVHPGCDTPSLPSAAHWQVEDLLYTLLDTIEMSKIRLVEPDHFQEKTNDATTKKFELFKWLLPAVVGEITPHTIKTDPNGVVISNEFQGGTNSFQQVSFEYNPLGQTLTGLQTGSTGPIMYAPGSIDLSSMSPSLLLQDQNAQNYLSQQEQMAAIAATIEQLQSI